MHYRDGTEARLGDLVRGKGYNVKDAAGDLAEIQGVVVGLTPGSDQCNVVVAHPKVLRLAAGSEVDGSPRSGSWPLILCGEPFAVSFDREYGQCDHFELVRRAE